MPLSLPPPFPPPPPPPPPLPPPGQNEDANSVVNDWLRGEYTPLGSSFGASMPEPKDPPPPVTTSPASSPAAVAVDRAAADQGPRAGTKSQPLRSICCRHAPSGGGGGGGGDSFWRISTEGGDAAEAPDIDVAERQGSENKCNACAIPCNTSCSSSPQCRQVEPPSSPSTSTASPAHSAAYSCVHADAR